MFVTGARTYLLGEHLLRPDTYSLLRGSVPVPISRKRFEVLLYLVEERHRVVTRQELVERFWEGREVYEENVTKCVSELRKALDDQQKPYRLIDTLPTVGYRYIGPVEDPRSSAEPIPTETPAETQNERLESTLALTPSLTEKSAPPPAMVVEPVVVAARSFWGRPAQRIAAISL